MDFEGLTEELKAKAQVCKTPEELRALAKSEGFELADDQLEAISGGIGVNGCQGVCTDVCRDDGWCSVVCYNVGDCRDLGKD